MLRKNGGTRGEIRSSALWGTGSRGGESRSNALWGKGGRRVSLIGAAVFVLGVPLMASASNGKLERAAHGQGHHRLAQTYVSPGLLRTAHRAPSRLVRVIIQSNDGSRAAQAAFNRVQKLEGTSRGGGVYKRLNLVDGVAVSIEARKLAALRSIHGLTVTPDAPIALAGDYSSQVWPYEAGLAKTWGSTGQAAPQSPTIAVVDSGIEKNRADFSNGARVLADVNLCSLPNNTTPGDGRGHGTFVASIAAGSAAGYAGAAPNANLVSLDVMDDSGMARTSDVINAAQWIVANKDAYKIRVANFSLHSTNPSNFTRDPLDKAVEKLWFDGVTVVAAAGNYGVSGGPSRVKYAPGNDPFVITTGASDIGGTVGVGDDSAAPWSAYGYTYDGFWKPEIGAPGRYMVGAVPAGSTIAVEKAANVTAPGYIQLSGTSFSTPAVAGAAAQILARHPGFTPDQVKGALMIGARPSPNAAKGSLGVGELDAGKSIKVDNPPNPNKALDQFVGPDPSGGSIPVFNAISWNDAAKASISWDALSWDAVSWANSTVAAIGWGDISWDAVSLTDVSLTDVSLADVSLNDISLEDAADIDAAAPSSAYQLDPADAAAVSADPDLAVSADVLPPAVVSSSTTTSSSTATSSSTPTSTSTATSTSTPLP
jgi:serine protease AprX